MTKPVQVTDELLTKLYEAQKEHLIRVLQTCGNGDDGGDYINAATEIFDALRKMSWDQSDLTALSLMLNTPEPQEFPADSAAPYSYHIPILSLQACDGICDALYDLNCPALPVDDD